MAWYILRKVNDHVGKRSLVALEYALHHQNIHFKKIKCLDYTVGVVRYLTCKDIQKVGRRDNDGIVTHPHTHYSQNQLKENIVTNVESHVQKFEMR